MRSVQSVVSSRVRVDRLSPRDSVSARTPIVADHAPRAYSPAIMES